MKSSIPVGAAMVMLTLSAPALAGTSPPGQRVGQNQERLAETRCSNAGHGNLGERLLEADVCLRRTALSDSPELHEVEANGRDLDPGNSGAHNANNDLP